MSQLPVVCITGTSSGFGLEITCQLAKNYRVVATMRNMDKSCILEDSLSKEGLSADIQYCDVTKIDSITNLMTYIQATYGRLDGLINNAGYALGGYFEDCTDAEIRAQFDTNFFGVQAVTRMALPLLRNSAPSKIIMMSSIAGLTASPCISSYNASKWALEGFSESLLFELAPFNVDVVLVEPGPYNTAIFSSNLNLATGMDNTNSPYYTFSQAAKNKLETVIKKQLKDPSDVSQLIASIMGEKKPKFRYLVGNNARFRLWFRNALPFEWYRRIVIAVYLKLTQKKRNAY